MLLVSEARTHRSDLGPIKNDHGTCDPLWKSKLRIEPPHSQNIHSDPSIRSVTAFLQCLEASGPRNISLVQKILSQGIFLLFWKILIRGIFQLLLEHSDARNISVVFFWTILIQGIILLFLEDLDSRNISLVLEDPDPRNISVAFGTFWSKECCFLDQKFIQSTKCFTPPNPTTTAAHHPQHTHYPSFYFSFICHIFSCTEQSIGDLVTESLSEWHSESNPWVETFATYWLFWHIVSQES